MAFQITETTWLNRQKIRVGGALEAQMEHNKSYTAAELVTLIEKTFPANTYTNDELTTIRDALIADGIIETA